MTAAKSKAHSARRKAKPRAPSKHKRAEHAPRRWSQRVTETSNALDLKQGVFTSSDPKAIARSLARSAARSRRRKSDPYRSAMSMLTFYINRAGDNLPKRRRAVLEKAKDELRRLRTPARARKTRHA